VTTLTPEPTEADLRKAREWLSKRFGRDDYDSTDVRTLADMLASVRSEARRTAIEEATGKLDRRADYLRDAFNDMDRAIELRGQAAVLRSLIELPATEVK